MKAATSSDPRVERTRRAILDAFIALVGEQPYDRFGVAEIIARAKVGRATFYDHFRGKDDLLHRSMHWLLALTASAADPQPDEKRLGRAVAHFWDNRRLARTVLSHPTAPIVRRALAAILEERHPPARAVQIAGAQLVLIEAWVRGEITAGQDEIVDRLRATSRL